MDHRLPPIAFLLAAALAQPASAVAPTDPDAAHAPNGGTAVSERLLLDDFQDDDGLSTLGYPWRAMTDRVMGGVSDVNATLEEVDGRRCIRMRGDVRLENNGGFVTIGLDLADRGEAFNANDYDGVYLWVYGNGEDYSLHLRTPAARRPWQSYRAGFEATTEWREVRLPFSEFEGYRIDDPLDTEALRRLGIFGVGRAFAADLAVAEIGFFRLERASD